MNAVDTNILVYAVSADEPVKGPIAITLLDRLSAADTLLPWQVACEFGAVLTKLIARGRAHPDALAALDACRSRFPLVMPDPSVLEAGLRIHRTHGVAYWCQLIRHLSAADESRVWRD